MVSNMKVRAVIKGIISYILALVLAVVFALYLNANVGWFMLIALILALILSVFFAWLSSKTVFVSCHIDENLLSKGDNCRMTVTIKNKSIFPTTPIELMILNGDGVRSQDKSIIATAMPVTKKSFMVEFRADICGQSRIGIEQVKVTDYLGIISFKIKKLDYETLQKKVAVIPDIADVSPKDDRILKIMQASLNADDSEDNIDADTNTFGGFPGYDNREYVPGDLLKRINWKQSAKRDKLLIRLDDEMSSKSVSVVLDSVYKKKNVNIGEMTLCEPYKYCHEEDIIPRLAEDAIENALGIIKVMVLLGYTVNFYLSKDSLFTKYEIEDEKDVEALRIDMAEYSFSENDSIQRFPESDLLQNNGIFVFSTPNSYDNAYRALDKNADLQNTCIFSAMEEAKNSKTTENTMFFGNLRNKKVKGYGIKEKIKEIIGPLVVPYFLALVLSVTVFAVFRIEILSYWTVLQAMVCGFIFALCNYVKNHKLVGTMLVIILVMGIMSAFAEIAASDGAYVQWFMSGGDVVETTAEYLMSIVLVFTTFFSMVIYYYTQIQYRTSALLFAGMVAFVVYVKVMREIEIKYVILVIILNVISFLINTRKRRDKNKRIVGFKSGIISVAFFSLLFVLIALAVPKNKETRYYHVFEDKFLGGNTTMVLPQEYLDNSKYSGNADNFNRLNNRKLYVLRGIDSDTPLYLKRQVFDYYDFQRDRWYGDEYYSEYMFSEEVWSEEKTNLNVELLARAMIRADEIQPGFLAKYGMERVKNYDFLENKRVAQIDAQNFASKFYITPTRTVSVDANSTNVYASWHGTFGSRNGYLDNGIRYVVEFFDEFKVREKWLELGGANCDTYASVEMLNELGEILEKYNDGRYRDVAEAFEYEALNAIYYREDCKENTEKIPAKVKELALEITRDCIYDWEKAEALQNYFNESDFVYDLSYEAPDDSVEYFLFEGKTGTCSDFASAYVLMARAAGLTVRYVEGFVPDKEVGTLYENEYVVRTRSAHAYPEVYIQNFGFVVYEPTIAAIYGSDETGNGGPVNFVMTLGYRILLIFGSVSFAIVIVLFIIKILAPVIKEKYFLSKLRKAKPDKAVIMIYRRMVDKYSSKYIKNPDTYTPYEYAKRFESTMECDISPLAYLVERASYADGVLSYADKKKAAEIYAMSKQAYKKKK